jgi:hypothetical protein
MTVRDFKTEVWLPLSPRKVFPFFSNAANLNAIAPPWLQVEILTPLPVMMGKGTLIDYRVRPLELSKNTRV